MNAVNALLRDQQEAELAAAVAAANEWVTAARPIIFASFKLDELAGDLRSKAYDAGEYKHIRTGVYSEAQRYVEKAFEKLDEMLPGIRDDFISDNSKSWSPSLPEPDGHAVDEFNDALSEETISVETAVKLAEIAWNEAYREGTRL